MKKNKVPSIYEPGMGKLQIFSMPTDEVFLERLFRFIFERWWDEIHFGILVQGGVFEIKATEKPSKVAVFDGYLTIEIGTAVHIHVCIGLHTGKGGKPTPRRVQAHRRPSRAELYRKLVNGVPNFWALRLFNGRGEQVFHVYLPNPLFTHDMQYCAPNWSRLELWDTLRKEFLGLDPDPLDRRATQFIHD